MDSLDNAIQKQEPDQKMVIRDELRNIKMNRSETIASYLTRIEQVWDELAIFGEAVDAYELVKISLSVFSKQWATFVIGILARDKLSDWTKL